MPCSPWHDNVFTHFSGDICTLEPAEDIGNCVLCSNCPSELIRNFFWKTKYPTQILSSLNLH